MIVPVATLLVLANGLSVPTPASQPAPPPALGPTGPTLVRPLVPSPPPPGRFVFAFLPALTFGVSRVPSLDLPLYFGGRLARRPWALGYQLTVSSGLADRYLFGLVTHRHHLTAMHGFGRGARGLLTVGGGVALLVHVPVIEAEARVAWRFGPRRRGLVGLVSRLGWNVGYGERAPLPQFGLMLGMSTL